jgi:hypothetical protein
MTSSASFRPGCMTTSTPRQTINLATLYDQPEMPWSRAVEALGEGSLGPEVPFFLGTVGPDGRPHSAAIGAVTHDGTLYFTSGPAARKTRHLTERPAVTVSVRLKGIDVVFEGRAVRVTDPATIDTLAAVYAAAGWPASRDGDAITAPYSAQSAGPAPWFLYRLDVERAIGVGTSPPHGASSWRF